MKHINLKSWPTERISMRLLYVLAAVIAVVFAAFGLIGFDRPFDDNPEFNAPLFTDAVLALIYVLLAGAMVVAVWSITRSLKVKGERKIDGINRAKIATSVTCGTILLLVVTFLIGSSQPILINGKWFESWGWLKLADMFVSSSLILIVIAAGTVVYGNMKYIRKKHV